MVVDTEQAKNRYSEDERPIVAGVEVIMILLTSSTSYSDHFKPSYQET